MVEDSENFFHANVRDRLRAKAHFQYCTFKREKAAERGEWARRGNLTLAPT
jgi:hypothetical protein